MKNIQYQIKKKGYITIIFYEVDKDINGEYFSLNELLQKEKVKENNGDIIKFIEEFYNNK